MEIGSRYLCCVPNFRVKTLSFTPLIMIRISCWFFGNILYQLKKFPSTLVSERFLFFLLNHEWKLNFVKCFFFIYWADHFFFSFLICNMVKFIDWLLNIVPVLYSYDKSHFVIDTLSLLNIAEFYFLIFGLEILHLCSWLPQWVKLCYTVDN